MKRDWVIDKQTGSLGVCLEIAYGGYCYVSFRSGILEGHIVGKYDNEVINLTGYRGDGVDFEYKVPKPVLNGGETFA